MCAHAAASVRHRLQYRRRRDAAEQRAETGAEFVLVMADAVGARTPELRL